MMAILAAIAVVGRAFTYDRARAEALFLSDKMAYELNLSTPQYNAVYEINMDYFLGLATRDDVYGTLWSQRNYELQRVLTPPQYETFMGLNYFYRPVLWRDGRWDFRIYRRYQNRHHYYMGRPSPYASYRGGRHFSPGPRRGSGLGARRGPALRRDLGVRRGPAPRRDVRGQARPPRSNNLRGPAPRPNGNGGRVTRNGMVQRVGGSSRTTVTRRPSQNQQGQQFRGGGGQQRQQFRGGGQQRQQVSGGGRGQQRRQGRFRN